jgi:hypothetical protein
MSTGARVFQILFMVVGFMFLGVGLIGALASQKSEVNVSWICPRPDPNAYGSTCNTEAGSHVKNDIGVATVFALVGVGLQVAAAAISAGSRPTPSVPAFPHGRPPVPGYPAHPQAVPPAAPHSPSWPGPVSGG